MKLNELQAPLDARRKVELRKLGIDWRKPLPLNFAFFAAKFSR